MSNGYVFPKVQNIVRVLLPTACANPLNNGRVVKESELAVTKLSFWWRKSVMSHQVPSVLMNLPCTILILAQLSRNCKTCIEAWFFASIVFLVPFSQFHKLKDSIQLDKCFECLRSIDLFHSFQAWFDNFCYICQSWNVIASFIKPIVNEGIFWCQWHFPWIMDSLVPIRIWCSAWKRARSFFKVCTSHTITSGALRYRNPPSSHTCHITPP